MDKNVHVQPSQRRVKLLSASLQCCRQQESARAT